MSLMTHLPALHTRKYVRYLTLVAALTACHLVGAAEQPDAAKHRNPIQRGSTEWGLLTGFGISMDIWNGVANRQFIEVGGRIGRVLTEARGPGSLKGNFEVSLEIVPVLVVLQEESTYAASTVLLFRHYLAPDSRIRPFISFGAGVLLSTKATPPGTSRVNFSPQVGLGLAYRRTERTNFFFEYRLHHISNADLVEENPGINSSYFQFGMSLFR